MLERGDERQLDALAPLEARLRRRVAVLHGQRLVGVGLDPHRLDERLARALGRVRRRAVVRPAGCASGACRSRPATRWSRSCTARPAARRSLRPRQSAPRPQQGVLQRVLGVVQRAEHAVAVRVQLAADRAPRARGTPARRRAARIAAAGPRSRSRPSFQGTWRIFVAMPEYTPGTPSWVDLSSPDVDGSAAFYGELLGWTATEPGPVEETGGYRMFQQGEQAVAGLMGHMQEGQPTVWTTYISVADADETAAQGLGGGRRRDGPADGRDGHRPDGGLHRSRRRGVRRSGSRARSPAPTSSTSRTRSAGPRCSRATPTRCASSTPPCSAGRPGARSSRARRRATWCGSSTGRPSAA